MLVYACRLHGTPRPVEVAELAWAAPSELASFEVLPADLPLLARLAGEAG
jgi:hypothetical protein